MSYIGDQIQQGGDGPEWEQYRHDTSSVMQLTKKLAAMAARADDLAVECQAALHERDELREEVARLTKELDIVTHGCRMDGKLACQYWQEKAEAAEREVERLKEHRLLILGERDKARDKVDRLDDTIRSTPLDLRAAGDEIERLTKLNDLLMDDKHDCEKGQRRRELLEMCGEMVHGTVKGTAWVQIVHDARSLIAAVDAAMAKEKK